MKKIIIIIIAFLSLVGCSKGDLSNQEFEIKLHTKTQGEFEIVEILDNSTNLNKKEKLEILKIDYYNEKAIEKFPIWEEYFYDKYNLDININVINYEIEKHFIEEENFVLYLNTSYYNGNKTIYNMINDYSLNGLNSAYEKYQWYQDINTDYIEFLKKGREIVAIPCVDSILIRPRFYNKKYIDLLDINIPENINEFTEYLIRVKELNEENQYYYPMILSLRNITTQASDLFRAFNVYVNSNESSMICLNPKTNSFEDAVFSEDFNNAFTYIRKLQQDGLLGFVRKTTDFTNSKNLATERYNIYNNNHYDIEEYKEPNYETYNGYYLVGYNDEKLIEVRKELSFYLFPKNNSDFEETINLFNGLFTDRSKYYDLRYGIEDQDYFVFQNRVYTEIENTKELIDLNILLQLNDQNKVRESTLRAIDTYNEKMFFETNRLTDVLSLSSTFPKIYDSSLNMLIQAIGCNMIGNLFDKGFSNNEITSDLSIEDSINEYKRMFLRLHGPDVLEQLNSKIGETTKYNYEK